MPTGARSGLPAGGDIGVESAGFVPIGFTGFAYLADRSSPNSPTKGTDSILTLSAADVRDAGVRDGDLLIATEAVGRTIAVHCTPSCTVTKVGDGPEAAHPEGHIVFTSALPQLPAASSRRPVGIALIAAAVLVLLAAAAATVRARRGRSPSPA